MQHIVYVNDKPLRFVDVYDVEQWKGNTQSIFVAEKDLSIAHAIDELEKEAHHPGFIYMTAEPDAAWKIFISYCTLIEAAGGVVANQKGNYLMIFRRGTWDLPKGKMDYDESPAQTAIREVKEECGLVNLEIISELPKTYHAYWQKGKRMLKKTHWFLMRSDDVNLIPQADEDIEKAVWMSTSEIRKEVFENCHASIKELLKTLL